MKRGRELQRIGGRPDRQPEPKHRSPDHDSDHQAEDERRYNSLDYPHWLACLSQPPATNPALAPGQRITLAC
ncbi:MAG TPA: hypothetical protein VFU22_18070, partial [Roseiflexaceae bacterium]|nr:hypothetical protein [Roseiflexaceae bacterium]